VNDKELLKMAAKAAGIELLGWMEGSQTYGCRTNTLPQYVEGVGQHNFWNPLTNDGDALRLAVKLGINCWRDGDVIWCNGERFGFDDPYAATRRAIVRCAAEIGKGLK
jgi:hypothetical protein